MRIAVIVRNLSEGGAERVAALWATGFYERGNTVSVFVTNKDAKFTYPMPQGVGLSMVYYQHAWRFMKFVGNILSLRKALKTYHPDVTIDVSPRWMRRISMIGIGGKKISTEHWSFERPENARVQPKKINKIYLNRLYDYVTVLTQADKNVIGNRLKHVSVMPNPLAFKPVDQLPEKEKIILAVGRLDGWQVKGFDLLIKAWGRIGKYTEGWRLQIAGGGGENSLQYLKCLCEDVGVVGSVDFLGYQSDIQSFFSKASIFVLSSRYEGFGLVLIEAMSQGCACVACDYKGRQREIIRSESEGIICEPDNVEDLGDSILALVKDTQKRRLIGENGVFRSKDYTLDNIMARWDNILKEIIK